MSKKEEKKKWHYVRPKEDCPHIFSDIKLKSIPTGVTKQKCKVCEEDETWICLTCGGVFCSRYKNSHMTKHNEENPDHSVVVSFSDLSFWCYKCNDYISHPMLRPIYKKFEEDKFGKKKTEKKHDTTEFLEKEDVLKEKISKAAKMFKESKYTVIYSGAGISTSMGIPDYRGPNGMWTLRDQGRSASMHFKLSDAKPSYCHKVINEFIKNDKIQHIVSTNVDGLHMKSGVPMENLSELHGNIFKEYCVGCGKKYIRDFDTTDTVEEGRDETGGSNHYTMRKCDDCGDALKDSIIHFNESLPKDELETAVKESSKSQLSIVLGTSMKVQPACSLPFYGKNKIDGKVIIVNLQKTPYDDDCDLKIYCKTDPFWKKLIDHLGIESKVDYPKQEKVEEKKEIEEINEVEDNKLKIEKLTKENDEMILLKEKLDKHIKDNEDKIEKLKKKLEHQ